jgi:hypothetical protein
MPTININNFLRPLSPTNPEVRDYAHASRTFRANAYALHPRLSYLYLCVFNFAPGVADRFTNEDKIELPLMVKSVDLPSYSIDVQEQNQYNKRVYSQHKIEYGDTRIVFHDDAKELVLKMWYNYMTHYYLDSTYRTTDFQVRDRYTERNVSAFGYANGNEKFFNTIQLYTLFNGRFSEYTLINPIISSFQHGQHIAGDNQPLEHTMSVKFETVLYGSGNVDDNNPKTFLNSLHYDNRPSPLGNIRSTESGVFPGPFGDIFPEGSILDSIGETIDRVDQIRPGTSTQLIGAINNKLGTTSLYNEVTPLLSSNIANNLRTQPVNTNAQDFASRTFENENSNFNIPSSVSSNGTNIGNNTYTNQTVQDFDTGNSFVQPTQYASASHPRKLSDTYLSRNDPSPVVSGSNTDIKKQQVEDRMVVLQTQLDQNASGESPLPPQVALARRRELIDLQTYYEQTNSPTQRATWESAQGITLNPDVAPTDKNTDVLSTQPDL